MMQVKGLIKYLSPSRRLLPEVVVCMNRLQDLGELNWAALIGWSKKANPQWTPLLTKEAKKDPWRRLVRSIIQQGRKLYRQGRP